LTPIAMSLDALRERYKARILEHYTDMQDPNDPTKRIPDPARTRLFATKENQTDPDVPLELDTNDPLYTWEAYENADVTGELVYFPTAFDQTNHGGKTKAQLLAENKQGWDIILLEDMPNLPAKRAGKTKGGRKQLEAGASSNEYLEAIKTQAMYQHESGFTT